MAFVSVNLIARGPIRYSVCKRSPRRREERRENGSRITRENESVGESRRNALFEIFFFSPFFEKKMLIRPGKMESWRAARSRERSLSLKRLIISSSTYARFPSRVFEGTILLLRRREESETLFVKTLFLSSLPSGKLRPRVSVQPEYLVNLIIFGETRGETSEISYAHDEYSTRRWNTTRLLG